jgi:hypothetical protein
MGYEKIGFTEGYDVDPKRWFNAASTFVKIILQRCSFYRNIKDVNDFFLELRGKKTFRFVTPLIFILDFIRILKKTTPSVKSTF